MSALELVEALIFLVIVSWGVYAARSWGAADEPRVEPIPSGLCVSLSPDVLNAVNDARRVFGEEALTVAGFSCAVAVAPRPGPLTRLQWITYLILFETSLRADQLGLLLKDDRDIHHSLMIDPSAQWNGQPHSFLGLGGRPSHWSWNDKTPARVIAGDILRAADPYDWMTNAKPAAALSAPYYDRAGCAENGCGFPKCECGY